jgi:hypothetical protein
VNPADAEVQFDRDLVIFGDLPEGEKAGAEYIFTNIGNRDLEIDVVSACDCIMTDWPTEPIRPGQTGKITAVYDSAGHLGQVSKDIDVIFKNTDKAEYPLVKRVVFKINVLRRK